MKESKIKAREIKNNKLKFIISGKSTLVEKEKELPEKQQPMTNYMKQQKDILAKLMNEGFITSISVSEEAGTRSSLIHIDGIVQQ